MSPPLRGAGELSCLPPRVQAAQRVNDPSDAQFLHSLQHVQLARFAQTPAADANLKHQDGGGQVHFIGDGYALHAFVSQQ